VTGPDAVFGEPLGQPDQRSCGAAVLVVARMLLDRDYAELLASGRHPVTGSALPGPLPDRFGHEVLAMHARVTGPVDATGHLQVPWPRALGTPPWAVARELSALSGLDVPARRYGWHLARLRPGTAFDRAAAGVDAGRPVGLYVGSTWLPRHVVLAVARASPDSLWIYDPGRGARVEVTRAAVESGALTFGRWDRLWFDVSPR
jgi:hypothetical protein